MKKRNTVQVIAALFFILIVVFVGTIYINSTKKLLPQKTTVQLYYYDPISMELIPQKVSLKLPQDNLLKIKEILEALKTPPKDSGLFPVLNKKTKVNNISIDNGICTIDLNRSSTEIQPLTVRKEAIRIYGIVNTLTDLQNIKAVQILIDGETVQYFTHYIKIDTPLTHYSSELPSGKTVNLYFASPDISTLLLEKREVVFSQDPVVLAKETLRELLYGSMEGLKNLFPKDTRVIDFYIKSGGIGIVNFDKSILEHSVGAHEEQLLVMSLVNSLTEFPDIQSVQILIDSNKVDTLFGSTDLSSPIERFFGMSKDNSTIIPYYIYTVKGKDFFCPVPQTAQGSNRIESLFTAIKNPGEGLKTYVPQSATLERYKIENNGTSILLDISCNELNETIAENLKEQIALSYTELPNISRVDIILNGNKETLHR